MTGLGSLPSATEAILADIPGIGRVEVGTGGFEGPGTILIRPDVEADAHAGVVGADPDAVEPVEREPVSGLPSERSRPQEGSDFSRGIVGDGDHRAGQGLRVDVEGDFVGLLTIRLNAAP